MINSLVDKEIYKQSNLNKELEHINSKIYKYINTLAMMLRLTL